MKKLIILLAAVMLMAVSFTACGTDAKNTAAAQDTSAADDTRSTGKKVHVVTTIFPEYDWVRNVIGEKSGEVEVKMLLDNGVDLHSYQPTAEDILKISTCDLFIYVGGESDKWVADALKEATNKDMVVINLLEVLGDSVKEEELVDGMEGEEEEEEGEEEGPEYDEHVWLSVRDAEIFVNAISEAMQKIDAENAETYKKNTAEYLDKLKALDEKYSKTISESSKKTLIFGDRFPFRYMVDDYALSYYAAFVGCSAETEASFETIIFLAEKMDELSLHTILTIEGSNQRIAETIINNTKSKDQKVLSINSLQSVTSKDVQEGVTYLSVMEKNLEVLKEALQ